MCSVFECSLGVLADVLALKGPGWFQGASLSMGMEGQGFGQSTPHPVGRYSLLLLWFLIWI